MVELKACRREPTAEMIDGAMDALEAYLRKADDDRFGDVPSWREQVEAHPAEYELIRGGIIATLQGAFDAAPAVPVNVAGTIEAALRPFATAELWMRPHDEKLYPKTLEGLTAEDFRRARSAADMLAALSHQHPPAEGEDDVAPLQDEEA